VIARKPEGVGMNLRSGDEPMRCPELGCDGTLTLKGGKHGAFYGCTKWRETGCLGAHGAHAGSGRPLGTPAPSNVREARKRAHEAFDQLWQGPHSFLSRGEAYALLRQVMNLTKAQTHIALFDESQCDFVVEWVNAFFAQCALTEVER
jgi:hypothetical protein